MIYPTMEEVEQADRLDLARWYRFLKSPGLEAAGRPEFRTVMEAEGKIMDRICARFKELGSFSPEISKAIGWNPQ